MYNETEFLEAIKASFKEYVLKGARSSDKLVPIHSYLAEILQDIFGIDYEVDYNNGIKIPVIGKKGQPTKKLIPQKSEKKVEGKYYPKDIDITVSYKGKPVFCLGVKFITSNYFQNANNYFENMLGETANIRRAETPYAHVIIMCKHTPYYENGGICKKIEIIGGDYIAKYNKLMNDSLFPHQPNAIGILLVDIIKVGAMGDDRYSFEISTPKKKFLCPDFKIITISKKELKSDPEMERLTDELSMENLFHKIKVSKQRTESDRTKSSKI